MPPAASLAAPAGVLPDSLSDAALARESERAQAAIKRRRWVVIGLRLSRRKA